MSKKIKKFEFVNLGLFKGNYNIVLSNNITVITGNNGNGKTTIINGCLVWILKKESEILLNFYTEQI